MKNDWRFQRNSRTKSDRKRLMGALLIPLIVIVLIVVIVVADRFNEEKPAGESTEIVTTVADTMAAEKTSEAKSSDETDAPAESEPADAFSADNFERDGIPGILDLMKQYFLARTDADAAAMNLLYGIGEADLSVVELEAQKTRMRSNSKYVTGFENIATYVKPGITSDTWLVYTTAEIKFRSVKNTAPMIMWCYVTKDAEGGYLLADNRSLSSEVLTYVDAAGRSEEVRRLAADVNTRLRSALNEDSDLQQVYGILNSDSPLWVEDNANTDSDIVILGDETPEGESMDPTEPGDAESSRNADEAGPAGVTPAETEAGAEAADTPAA